MILIECGRERKRDDRKVRKQKKKKTISELNKNLCTHALKYRLCIQMQKNTNISTVKGQIWDEKGCKKT